MRVRVFPKTLRVEIENETRVFPESLIFETEMRVSQKSVTSPRIVLDGELETIKQFAAKQHLPLGQL